MATAAVEVTDKKARTVELRAEAAALEKSLSKLRADLDSAKRDLAVAEGKRQRLVESAGRGESVKPATVAAVESEIDAGRITVEAFAPTVASKDARLATVRDELQTVEHEIALDAAAAARRARFDELAKQGREVAARISQALLQLIEKDLVALDGVRDALLNEFIGGPFSDALTPEANAARTLTHELTGTFFDGPMMRHERRLLREGWTVRGDLQLSVQNLKPPRK